MEYKVGDILFEKKYGQKHIITYIDGDIINIEWIPYKDCITTYTTSVYVDKILEKYDTIYSKRKRIAEDLNNEDI